MSLPLIVSVPHAGLDVPEEVRSILLLSPKQIAKDSDEGAREVYDLSGEVATFVTTGIARAVVDMNRAPDDRRPDGVVKTHTCWNEQVYREPLSGELAQRLIDKYYHPYHERLTGAATGGVVLGVDCHTMAAQGPPVGPDPGETRPEICLSNGDGTCSVAWLHSLAECFEDAFGITPALNVPFKGGYIVRAHAFELPWVQLELSRAPFDTIANKRAAVLQALARWCERLESRF